MIELLAAICWVLLSFLSMRAVALLLSGPDGPTDHEIRLGARPATRLAPALELPDAPRPTGRSDAGNDGVRGPSAPDASRCGVVLLGRDEDQLGTASGAARRHLSAFWQERVLTAPPPYAGDSLGSTSLGARVAVLGSGRAADTEAALHACMAAGRPLLIPACT
jgi:hypothetical protein